jgi:hypothetical protein
MINLCSYTLEKSLGEKELRITECLLYVRPSVYNPRLFLLFCLHRSHYVAQAGLSLPRAVMMCLCYYTWWSWSFLNFTISKNLPGLL